MKVKIGKKIFEGYHNPIEKCIKITLIEKEDKDFFIRWRNKSIRSTRKNEYVIDLKYKDGDEMGFLKNCYPIVRINVEYVTLFYEDKEFCDFS